MKLLRPGEAAKMVGVSTRTLRNLEDSGVLNPVVLPSGHRRYKLNEIESILEDKVRILKRRELVKKLRECNCDLEDSIFKDSLVMHSINDSPEVHYRSNYGVIECFTGEPSYGIPWSEVSSEDMERQLEIDSPIGWWLRYHRIDERFNR